MTVSHHSPNAGYRRLGKSPKSKYLFQNSQWSCTGRRVVWQTKQVRSRQKTKIIKQSKRSKTRRPVGNTRENISYGERFEE